MRMTEWHFSRPLHPLRPGKFRGVYKAYLHFLRSPVLSAHSRLSHLSASHYRLSSLSPPHTPVRCANPQFITDSLPQTVPLTPLILFWQSSGALSVLYSGWMMDRIHVLHAAEFLQVTGSSACAISTPLESQVCL